MMSAPSTVTSARESPRRRSITFGRIDWSTAAFAALLILGAALVLRETRGLSFFGDEWDFVVDRRGLSANTLLRPHGPHLVLIPILIYKALLQVFGGSSYLPFRMLAVLDLVVLALVVGIICRQAWGKWWGLAPVLMLVTLGPGGVTLLWPFETEYAIAIVAGLVGLIALGRDGRAADLVACFALLISVASGSHGIGFIAGAAAMLAIRGGWRRRVWVVIVPVVLYGLWYLKYGRHASETELSLWSSSLVYVMNELSATFAGALGLSSVPPHGGLLDTSYGQPLALAAIALVVVVLWRGWRPPPLFWGALVTLLALWVASSLSNTAAIPRPPQDPRYLSSNSALLFVCLCVAAPRPRLRAAGVAAVLVALAVIAATNASYYRQSRAYFQWSDTANRAELGALLIMRDVVASHFSPDQPGLPGVLVNVQAAGFFDAVDSFGLTADPPSTLLHLDEATREGIDRELQRGERIGLSLSNAPHRPPATAPPLIGSDAPSRAGCLMLGTEPAYVQAHPGVLTLTASSAKPMTVALRRFSSRYDTRVGSVAAGHSAIVRIPRDRAPEVPWRVMVAGHGGRVCAVGP